MGRLGKKRSNVEDPSERSEFWTDHTTALSKRLWSPINDPKAINSSLSSFPTALNARTWFKTRVIATVPVMKTISRVSRDDFRSTCAPSAPALVATTLVNMHNRIDKRGGKLEPLPTTPPPEKRPKPVLKPKRKKKEVTEEEEEKPKKKKKKGPLKSQSWCIHPTDAQRATLMLWLEGGRVAYNLGVDCYNETKVWDKTGLKDGSGVGTGVTRGDKAKLEKTWETQVPEHLWSVPADIRKNTMLDVHRAVKAHKAKEEKARKRALEAHRSPPPKSKKLELKHREPTDPSQTAYLELQYINCQTERSVYAPIFGTVGSRQAVIDHAKPVPKELIRMKIEKGNCLPAVFASDSRLQYIKATDKFYLLIPMALHVHARLESTKGHIAAIDPGVRTFATVYDPGRQRTVELAYGHTNRILRWKARKATRIDRRADVNMTGRCKRNAHERAAKIREDARNLVKEMHHKTALWLCQNYETILLPKFGVKSMAERVNDRGQWRKLSKETVSTMYQQAHYAFQQFLLHKAREYNTQVIVCDERWTSKTCTCCGMLHHKLGAAKVFTCPYCSATYDRDAGAARNILLRYLA